MRVTAIICAALMLAGCQTVPPRPDRPCGVISDSLIGVDATTREGQRRLDQHFERGVSAGCWRRS